MEVRLIISKQEAHYRGYRIEGQKRGQVIFVKVSPSRWHLPVLRFTRFRVIRSTWAKTLVEVAAYIDEMLTEITCQRPLPRTAKFDPLRHTARDNKTNQALIIKTTALNSAEDDDVESLRILLRETLRRLQARYPPALRSVETKTTAGEPPLPVEGEGGNFHADHVTSPKSP